MMTVSRLPLPSLTSRAGCDRLAGRRCTPPPCCRARPPPCARCSPAGRGGSAPTSTVYTVLYLPGDCGGRGLHRNTRMDAIPRGGGGGGGSHDVRDARHDEVRGGGRDQTRSLPRNQTPFHLQAAAGNMMWTLTLLLRISTVSKVPPPDYKF